MTLVLDAVLILAAYRLTRFVTRDEILNSPRDWVKSRARFLDALLGCPHCASVWVVAILVAIVAQYVSVPYPVLQALAVMGGVSILNEWLGS